MKATRDKCFQTTVNKRSLVGTTHRTRTSAFWGSQLLFVGFTGRPFGDSRFFKNPPSTRGIFSTCNIYHWTELRPNCSGGYLGAEVFPSPRSRVLSFPRYLEKVFPNTFSSWDGAVGSWIQPLHGSAYRGVTVFIHTQFFDHENFD